MRYPIHIQSQQGPFNPYEQGRFQVQRPYSFHGLRQRSGYFPARRTRQIRRFSRVPTLFAREQIRIAPSFWGSRMHFPSAFLSGRAIPRGFPAPILTNWDHVIDPGFPRGLRVSFPRSYFQGGSRRIAAQSAQRTVAVPHAIIGWVGEDDDDNRQISRISIAQGGKSVHISGNGNSDGLGRSIIIDNAGIHTRVGGSITLQGHETVDAEPEVVPIVKDVEGQTTAKLTDKELDASAGASAKIVTAAVDTVIAGIDDKKSSQVLISGSNGIDALKTDHVQTSLPAKLDGHKEMHSKSAGQKIIETAPVVIAAQTVDKHVKGIDNIHKDKSIILNPVDAIIHKTDGQGETIVETVSTDVKADIKDAVAAPTVLVAPAGTKAGADLSKAKVVETKASKADVAIDTKLTSVKVTDQKEIKPKAVIDIAINDADKVSIVGAADKKGKLVKTDTASSVEIATAEVTAEKIITPVVESVVKKTSAVIGSETGVVTDKVGAKIASETGDLSILVPEAKKVDKIASVKQVVEKVDPIKETPVKKSPIV